MKTTKTLFALFVLCVASMAANAQSFGDNKIFSAGIGLLGSPFVFSGSDVTMPPIQLSLEVPFKENIGIGGVVGYAGSEYKILGGAVKYSYILVGARGNYHFAEAVGLSDDKIDLYGGLTLGYNIASGKWDGPGSVPVGSAGGFLWGLSAGGRYYLSDKVGVNAELGYGIAVLTLGASFKF